MLVRRFAIGEESALREVFYSSIHELTGKDYTPEQQQAWAPADYDPALWESRIHSIKPFILELDGIIAGYADLQPSGLIDHFYISGRFAHQGLGRALMAHLHLTASELGIVELWSKVSLTAEPFFIKSGFHVETRNAFFVRGVQLFNATMRKSLAA